MINHVCLTGILCPVNDSSIFRNIKIKRQYKNINGKYDYDFLRCIFWTKNRNNELFSYKDGSFVTIDGRIETDEEDYYIVIEQLVFICNSEIVEKSWR